jgi:arsenate reductase-like glutaredoxin family protein
MKTLKTISGREINVTANHSKKTFTIRTTSAKFRTNPMNKEEFNSCLDKTGNDWQQFLKGNDYYIVN